MPSDLSTTEARESLADEVAHDLVAPPDLDAGEAETREVFRFIGIARDAALAVLVTGGTVDAARAAAEDALDGDMCRRDEAEQGSSQPGPDPLGDPSVVAPRPRETSL